jgi:hypothetical protein
MKFIVFVLNTTTAKWIRLGETYETRMAVPIRNTVAQPYGVSAVCE